MLSDRIPTVDDINVNPALPEGPLKYGNFGIFLMMGKNAGCISCTLNRMRRTLDNGGSEPSRLNCAVSRKELHTPRLTGTP